jgi:endogenous inhibitor of DNA gyrase (YacG/DUF329 family)
MTRACPICGDPAAPAPGNAHAPFCSRRCKDRDLLQWLGEGYRVAGAPIDEEALDSPRNPD